MIVDDEADLLAELKPLLERSGFDVVSALDGEQALALLSNERPALIVLDMLMPHLDGRDVLRRLREKGDWTPVILLTKVNTAVERVLSLQEGADDYLNKPFDPLELVARIQAVLRRTKGGSLPPATARLLTSGRLVLDRHHRQALLDGQPLNLTVRALGVLEFLMMHAHEIIPRDRLIDEVWGWSAAFESRVVDVRMAEIRKALDDDSGYPEFIETIVGTGYRFIAEVRSEK
jgi:DNA-binding response OmpR family regulator